jgi:hypothetical protein
MIIKQKAVQPLYMVSVYDEPGSAGSLRFTFVPKQARVPGSPPKPVPEYILSIKEHRQESQITWLKPPSKESTKVELEQVARQRVLERVSWIQRVLELVNAVEGWAKDIGWSTKRIEKRIEDARLGNHKAAGLVMQEDAVRILLEPISASAPGSDGLVDLYLMPGYDDIASLYHQDTGWHVHCFFSTGKDVAAIKESESRPLSKKILKVVLDELKKHAE